MLFVWLFLYGTVTLAAGHLSARFYWAEPVGLAVYTAALILWALAKKKGAVMGLKKVSKGAWKNHLFFLPYFALVFYNIFYKGTVFLPWLTVLEIFSAAVLEELVFRGFLLQALRRRGGVFSILTSGAIFALVHLLNIETGAAYGILWQSLCAFILGIALSGLRLSCGSLLPGMAVHFLINLTGWAFDPATDDPVFWVCMAIYLLCGIRSISLIRKEA